MSTNHTIRQGECIESLADRYGFFPDTLWKHADNSELRDLRKDQNILQPGDVVVIPDLTRREERVATEQKHTFRRLGVPAKLRVVFFKPIEPEEDDNLDDQGDGGEGPAPGASALGGPTQDRSDESVYEEEPVEEVEEREPIADAPFRFEVHGHPTEEGQSDSEGLVEVPIPLGAREGTITFYPDTDEAMTFDLDLGQMDSIETPIGVRKRLCNMGYRCSPEGDELDADLRDALRRFQAEYDLDTNGEIDQPTKDKILEVNGS